MANRASQERVAPSGKRYTPQVLSEGVRD